MAKRIKGIVWILLLAGICTGCAKKAEPAVQQEPEPQQADPVLSIPFVTILDNYFFNDDTSGFAECIGKIVTEEEMIKVRERYSSSSGGDSLVFRESKDRTLLYKKVMYTITGIRRPDGMTDYKIFDITALEGRKGYYLAEGELNRGESNNPRYIIPVRNYSGLFEYKFSDGLPFDKKITPKWIVTANEEGKIIISEPVDDSMYIYFSSDPE